MNNRYALIRYDDNVVDYLIGEEFDKITLGELSTFETLDEAIEQFDKVLGNFGYEPVETPSRYADWEKIAIGYIDRSYVTASSEAKTRTAIVRLLSTIALAQVDLAKSAMLNNEIMARFLDPVEE